jgi:ABC-type molybdate transport system substrate-binding protein
MCKRHETNIGVLSAVAIHAELEDLLPRFTREQGIAIEVNYDVNPAVAKRVMGGEMFDVGLNNPWYVNELIAQGSVVPDVHVPFGRSPLAMERPEMPGKSSARMRPSARSSLRPIRSPTRASEPAAKRS